MTVCKWRKKAADNQTHRIYCMTKDGFTLLVMGFNGKNALEWKLKYIEAFNKIYQDCKGRLVLMAEVSFLETTA